MSASARAPIGAGATLRLLIEATPVPPGFADGADGADVSAATTVAAFERMRDAREAIIDAIDGRWDVDDPIDAALLAELNERDQLWRRALNEALSQMTAEQRAAELAREDDG